MEVDEARGFLSENHRAVLATRRRDGSPQLSPVAAAVDGSGRVVVSTREAAAKTRNARRDPRVSLLVMSDGFYGKWVQIDGTAGIVPLPAAMEGLVEYYRRVAGEHPDWAEYRAAMESERRVLLTITIERAGPDVSG
ncbi:MAG: PPOX class F420-dependent oxidoreductase [Acidimicrobiales bacterium]